MKWLIRGGAAIAALIIIVVIAGAMLPVTHSATRSVVLAKPPQDVWFAITDYPTHPSWRTSVKRIERQPDQNGHSVWLEDYGDFTLSFETMVNQPPFRLVRRIVSNTAPFMGQWEYQLSPEPSGTRVVIVETGQVPNPIFRFVSRFIIGHHASLDEYLIALGRKFGENVTPQ